MTAQQHTNLLAEYTNLSHFCVRAVCGGGIITSTEAQRKEQLEKILGITERQRLEIREQAYYC